MFLFTTSTGPAPGSAPATPVVDAIRQAADQTGTSFEYLLSTAKRESSLDPQAKAGSSSATGLYQFIEQTWLGLMKQEGPRLGLSDLSDAISARGEGGYAVADGSARSAILKLREDPRLSAMMAGVLTQQNRTSLSAATGREPNSGELYLAHVLGPRGAADVIKAANDNPDRPVAEAMPEAAAANRSIFFDRQGRARGAGELYAILAAGPASGGAAPTGPRTETGLAPAVTQTGPALQGLFRTGGRVGPISDAVAKIWRVNNTHIPAKQAALSFFPRDDDEGRATDAAAPADAAPVPDAALPDGSVPGTGAAPPVAAGSVPLPPPRPKLQAEGGRSGPTATPVKRSGRPS